MADFSKMKRKGLGTPPSFDEAATSLNSSEIAPDPRLIKKFSYVRRDARRTRKTNRTLPFATRVSPEFDAELRDIAEEKNLKLVELLEEMLSSYKKQNNL
ncbi:hypothetical protein GWK90_05360 [Candidatus Hamiltonella defensa]|nr:hypothetical protein [Candidatus Hamiltonella defensa]MBK4361702.1 hypothetical protein [Candidatus Hamiltonella defensa]